MLHHFLFIHNYMPTTRDIKFKKKDGGQLDEARSNRKYGVRLPLKSHAARFADIERIIQGYPHRKEGRFQFITFYDLNIDLENVLGMARSLSAFKFYVDGNEIPKSKTSAIQRVLFCEYKNQCQGVCMRSAIWHPTSYQGFSVPDILHLILAETYFEPDIADLKEMAYIGQKAGWISFETTKTHNITHINPTKLLSTVKNGLSLECSYCPIIKWEEIEKQVQEIPPDRLHIETDLEGEEGETTVEPILVSFTEEQIDLLVAKISTKMQHVFRDLFIEAGLLKKRSSKKS
ncbi:MAG: hypothetical protein ACFFFG_01525 [Candidatus Thorarchaeota archaeon]